MEPSDCNILQRTYTCYDDFHLWNITLLELSSQQTNCIQLLTNSDQESLFILKERENTEHRTPSDVTAEYKQDGRQSNFVFKSQIQWHHTRPHPPITFYTKTASVEEDEQLQSKKKQKSQISLAFQSVGFTYEQYGIYWVSSQEFVKLDNGVNSTLTPFTV